MLRLLLLKPTLLEGINSHSIGYLINSSSLLLLVIVNTMFLGRKVFINKQKQGRALRDIIGGCLKISFFQENLNIGDNIFLIERFSVSVTLGRSERGSIFFFENFFRERGDTIEVD